ncbi:hypothetical protein GW17_00000516 [Ensete ventricosum]|nr:hypothetical protein GW17_00000516 [Ensete ventricosum]
MRTARYRAIPPKIDRQRLISAIGGRLKGEIDRRRSIEREKGKKKKKRKRRKKEKRRKNTQRPRAVLAGAPSPLACRCRPRVTIACALSRALFLPREEKDRGDIAPFLFF